MPDNSEMKINAEGIFVSCSHGRTRMWEFHPDDVTSVGVYSEDGQVHERIATLNRHFDVSETTRGLKELNDRLSRELKTELTIDAERAASPLGVVLWPSHLAGSALWEFYTIGEDGLASYVAPGTPNALRSTSHAVGREMARLAKPRVPEEFPKPLVDRGFAYHGDIGWRKDDAVMAAEWLHRKGAAIVDAELWLVKNAVVQPHIRTASGLIVYHYWTTTRPSETWESFANRTLSEATDFFRRFQWPQNISEPVEQDVRFCFSWVWRESLEDEEFTFPG